MSTVLSYISSVWVTYGSWIGLSLIPTIIAGLSVSPKTAGDAVIVQKIWDIIKHIMNVFSVATFKDVPGTFQLPLKLGSIVKNTSVTGSIILLFILGGSGCAWFTSTSKEVGSVVLHCAGQEITERSGELVQVVLAAAGTSSLEQIVEALVEKFGLDVAGCSVLASRDQVATSVGSATKLSHTIVLPETAQKLDKLNSIIVLKKWVPGS